MDFGVELPKTTLLLVSTSDWCVDYWPFVVGVCVLGPLTCWLVSEFALPSDARQRMLYQTPLLGPQWRWTGFAQFARLLAMLLDCKLPLPAALRLAGQGVGNAEIAAAARQLAGEVESGQLLNESATRLARFPAALAHSLRLSENTQSLAESLRLAAEMCEGRAIIDSELVFRIAPPFTMAFILFVLGFIVTGLFMPLLKLITELSG